MNRRQWEDHIWRSDLDPLTRLVALAVASFANKDGQCWPSHAAVAAKANLARTTVQRHIADCLTPGGWLRSEPRKSSHGKRSHLYTLTLPPRLGVKQDNYDPSENLWPSLTVVKEGKS